MYLCRANEIQAHLVQIIATYRQRNGSCHMWSRPHISYVFLYGFISHGPRHIDIGSQIPPDPDPSTPRTGHRVRDRLYLHITDTVHVSDET